MRKSFLFPLLMGIIFFVSCTTENVQLDQTAKQNSVLKQSNIVELSKLWTINNSDSLAILKDIQKIDWDNAVVSNNDKDETLEVPLLLKNNIKVSYLETKNEVNNKLLFIKDASGKLNAYHMMIATKDKISSTDPSLSFSNLNSSFDGYVAFVNSSNKTVNLLPSVLRSKPSITGREIESCTYVIEMHDDFTYKIRALLFCTFGGGDATSNFGGGGGGGSGAGAPKVKITDYLTGKAKCLNDLLNKNGNVFVQKLLANFQGNSKFDINIVSADKVFGKDDNGNLIEANGNTKYDPKESLTQITIQISTSSTDSNSTLDAVRTILHEYIHADITRKLYSKDNIPSETDFKTVYSQYGNQHGTMAGLYLQSMKEALKDFHKNILPDDYQGYINYYGEEPSDAFYEALAWRGLQYEKVKDWTNLPQTEKERISKLGGRVEKFSRNAPCK